MIQEESIALMNNTMDKAFAPVRTLFFIVLGAMILLLLARMLLEPIIREALDFIFPRRRAAVLRRIARAQRHR
jgi:hypothetical protein